MTQLKGVGGARWFRKQCLREGGPFFKEENGKPLFKEENHEDHEQDLGPTNQ
jgi:hypothetical protein